MPFASPLPLNLQFVQNAVPTSGATVAMDDNSQDGILYLQPVAGLAALTISLPSEANSRIGQIRSIATKQAITILTVGGATTIMSAPASMLLGACYSFQKVAANTWIRCA